MVGSGAAVKLDELAHHLFDVVTRFCLAAPRARRRGNDLKDIEFLTLSLLHQRESLIVGDIQRQLGVLPAQMSRIIRALETRDEPLIACRINPQDKRKIDVILTGAGHAAFQEHQADRVRVIAETLAKLTESERDDLRLVLDRLLAVLDPRPVL
ncbi:MAG: MarR family transcriptional regulator [Gemmataceae bacterium]